MADELTQLPRLRRKRKFDIPKIIGRFNDGVRKIDGQVTEYHQRWDAHNETARSGDGPLWIALGDSSSQGVGASDWSNGWTHAVLERIREATGEPWRIVNLSMSGGRFADVTDRQLPVLNQLLPEPELVTCVIGSNDLMWRRGRPEAIYRDAQAMVNRLPPATWLSHLNGPGDRPDRLNEIFADAEKARDLRPFNIWKWPSGRNALAEDMVHPSDVGYRHMADLAWSALEGHFTNPHPR